MEGETGFQEQITGTIGCSEECCRDAVEALLDHHEVQAFRAGFDLNLMGGAA
jgi:hypothetical protein